MNISNSREVSQMILQFSCSNHKSIKEKVTFSAIASSDNTFEETLKTFGNMRILPLCCNLWSKWFGKK